MTGTVTPESRDHWKSHNDNPSEEGERRVCILRFLICVFFWFGLTTHGLIMGDPSALWSHPAFSISGVWCISSILIYLLIRSGLYRSWISVLSVVIDISIPSVCLLSLSAPHSLDFSRNALTSLYWLGIGLAAFRRSVLLVLLSGLLSAISSLMIYAWFFHSMNIPSQLVHVENDVVLVTISYADHISKSLTMLFTAWIIAHITRQLRTTEREYEILFHHIPDGVLLITQTGHIEMVNSAFANLLGNKGTDIVGKPITEYFRESPESEGENFVQCSDATEIPVSISSGFFQTKADETRRILSVRDMSHHRELEYQLSHLRKMEALGQLSQGIAHDFNNLLGGILGAASLAELKLKRNPDSPVSPKMTSHFSMIRECAETVTDILKRLMVFSRASYAVTATVDLNRILNEVVSLTQKTMGPEYTVTVAERPAGEAPISVDQVAIIQAVLNLCINAKESMHRGGDIVLSLCACECPDVKVFREGSQKNNGWWNLSILDQGTGMSIETTRRSLEPFFTTKNEPARGTGLGLPISFSIIRAHGGFIQIHSILDQGTRIEIYLPGIRPPHDSGQSPPRQR